MNNNEQLKECLEAFNAWELSEGYSDVSHGREDRWSAWQGALNLTPAKPEATNDEWGDVADGYTALINMAHPTINQRHNIYEKAVTLVSHRHSKGALVDLVHYLLCEGIDKMPAKPEVVEDLLRDMRIQVQWTDKATMPIPLYERMKAAIQTLNTSPERVQKTEKFEGEARERAVETVSKAIQEAVESDFDAFDFSTDTWLNYKGVAEAALQSLEGLRKGGA